VSPQPHSEPAEPWAVAIRHMSHPPSSSCLSNGRGHQSEGMRFNPASGWREGMESGTDIKD
jgi:hypothetical protein